MKYVAVKSSNIESVGCNEVEEILAVRFLSGALYHYFGVPKIVFDNLLKAASPGRYINQEVKQGGYRYIQVQ